MRGYKAALGEALPILWVRDHVSDKWVSDRGLTRADVVERLRRSLSCGDRVVVGVGDEGLEVRRGSWCGLGSICAICSSRIQARRRAVYGNALRAALREYPYQYLLTFTVPDGPELGSCLDDLRRAWRCWYRKGQKRANGKRSGGERAKIVGAIGGVELKKSDRGAWHVHLHVLAVCRERLDYRVYDPDRLRAARRAAKGRCLSQDDLDRCVSDWAWVRGKRVPVSKLTREWIEASGGKACNVDARPLRGGQLDRERAAFEVLKYATKLGSVGSADSGLASDFFSLVCESYGRRLFSTLGIFFGSGARESRPVLLDDACGVLVWDQIDREYRYRQGGFAPLPDRETMRGVGLVLGAWRRERRRLLDKRHELGDKLAGYLDGLRLRYRAWIGAVYREGVGRTLVGSLRPPPAPADSVPVQLSFLPA